MYYSITFEIDGVRKNTWADWRLIPETPPMIPYPEVNLNYVDIPGRSGGPLDLTGVPFNKLTYKRISGSWNFLREPDSRRIRAELFNELNRYFIGRVAKIKLEEDLEHYYRGRIVIGNPTTSIGPIRIPFAFDLEPVRYNTADDTVDSTFAYEGGGS